MLSAKINDDSLNELSKKLEENNKKNNATLMVKHYRAFLIGTYAGYDLIPAEELVLVQSIHKELNCYSDFISLLNYEINIDGIVRKYGHADIRSMQKAAKKTISYLRGFGLKLSNKQNKSLKPIDISYNKMPTILY